MKRGSFSAMTSVSNQDRSRPVGIWLFSVAILVLAMVVVGGATRLTGSGLSITEWKPVTGAIPPMSPEAWMGEFERYKQIPQYVQLNKGMSLDAFKGIYWWEWSHRFLARTVGAAFALPLIYFGLRRQIPRRLLLPCITLFGLGGLQGAVGWWMVSSGLDHRVSVAPERLMTHLGLAMALLAALVWTGLEAWAGPAPRSARGRWHAVSMALLVGVYIQILLGALVAGNHAGLVYNDWPLMNGRLLPDNYFGGDLWGTLAHSLGAVQLHHRLTAYGLVIAGLVAVVQAQKSAVLSANAKRMAILLGVALGLQSMLGIITLVSHVPMALGMAHQVAAALVLSVVTGFLWIVRRQPG